ncbi:MAG TPA: TetR/AcrR family transcriptional regulator [Terriglobales bacterium]|nr:TetR/AcrR family transcriptional regulator [Terriglobales bacterium]
MGQKKPASSADRLRETARTLFAEKGYEATTISDITRAAGTSYSQFLKYFSGKEELRAEILEEQWSQLTSAVALGIVGISPASEKLKLALNMLISSVEGNASFRGLFLLEAPAQRKGERAVANPGFIEYVRVLDEILLAMKEEGELLPGVDPQVLRSALVGSIQGMLRDRLLAGSNGFPASYSSAQVRSTLAGLLASALDVRRPGEPVISGAPSQTSAPADDDWIRYYLKLADSVLGPKE